ncbi:MAG: hypothetical protein EOM54_10900 [Clostridia bacterium]|nr:hypothetical protein [Clostridia bacterium]
MSNFIQNTFTPYNVISTIIALWGIGIAIKSKRKIDFNYEKKSFNLIDESKNKFPGLEIKYLGQIIHDFSVTQIALWNCGNRAVNKSDLASSGTLSITGSEKNQILAAAIINISDENNHVVIQKEENKIVIDFEFFNPKQGASIQVIHTGNSSGLKLSYALKGSRNRRSIKYSKMKKKPNDYFAEFIESTLQSRIFKKIAKIYIIAATFAMFIVFLGATLSFYEIISKEIFYSQTAMEDPANGIFSVIFTIIFGLLFVITIFITHSRVPKKLQSFESLLTQENDDDEEKTSPKK